MTMTSTDIEALTETLVEVSESMSPAEMRATAGQLDAVVHSSPALAGLILGDRLDMAVLAAGGLRMLADDEGSGDTGDVDDDPF